MNILLINPPCNHMMRMPGQYRYEQNIHEYSPPIGLMYIKSYLRKYSDDEVFLYNFQTPDNPTLNDFINFIVALKPDVIGISVTTIFWYDVYIINKLIKEVLKSVIVVGGGRHMWLYPYESLTYGHFDIIVQGEGEKIFLEIINRIKSGGNFYGLDGVIFKNINGDIIKEKASELIENLDLLPFPDYSDINVDQYRLVTNSNLPAAMILSSRGCRYNCTYCFNCEKKLRTRSPNNIIEEIVERRNNGYKFLYFMDANLTGSRQHLKSLCEAMIHNNVILPWSCNARVNEVDEEIIDLMSKAGCQRISFGIESGAQHILDSLKKGTRLDQAENAISLARKAGITTIGLFMIGLPLETANDAIKTINFAKKLEPDYVYCNPFVPAPGTKIYNDALKDASFGGDYFKDFIMNPKPNIVLKTWPTKMSEKKIFYFQRLLYLKFYFRISKVINLLSHIYNLSDFFKKAVIALKMFLKII